MKHRLFLLLLPLLAVLFTACPSDPVDTTGNIEGTVYDAQQTGVRLQGASVSISKLNQTVTTGADGRYSFHDVEMGSYTVQVSLRDYVSDSKAVEVKVGETSTLDFSLRRAASALEVKPLQTKEMK